MGNHYSTRSLLAQERSREKATAQLIFDCIDNGEYEAKRLFECLAFRDLRRIDRVRDLRKGDHIVLHFERDGVSHLQHLVVSDIKDERFKGYGFIRHPHAQVDNSRRQKICTACHHRTDCKSIYKVVYPANQRLFSAEEIVLRAEKFYSCDYYAGSWTHGKIINNDEHFVTWCITGEARSRRSTAPVVAVSGGALGGVAGGVAGYFVEATFSCVVMGASAGVAVGLGVGLAVGVGVSYALHPAVPAIPVISARPDIPAVPAMANIPAVSATSDNTEPKTKEE